VRAQTGCVKLAAVKTAADARSLAIWADALFGGQVLKKASLDEMIDFRGTGEGFFEYGLGVMGAARPPWSEMVGHAGQIDGFQSEMWYLPDEDVTIVVLVNNDTFRLSRIVDDMLSAVLPQLHADALDREE
jgi:D-alanyl-D-alanine carboxypeptidase